MHNVRDESVRHTLSFISEYNMYFTTWKIRRKTDSTATVDDNSPQSHTSTDKCFDLRDCVATTKKKDITADNESIHQ